ncbi:MAG: GNAT family N-acetyltransferase [Promethearchaeota archaeon]
MLDLNSPIRLPEEKIKTAAKVMGKTFQQEPFSVYTLPDSQERKEKNLYAFEFILRYGTLFGEVYTTSHNLEGIAIWLPYWEAEMKARKIRKAGFNSFYKKMGDEYFKRLELCESHKVLLHKRHTADFSHWYLSSIGVNPIHQGKGYASKLLKPKLAQCEEQNIPCYLETHDEKNVSIYQHLGFDVIEEDITPNTNLSIFAMLRK